MGTTYKAAQLSEVCYIFEVAEWIALGRLPEVTFGSDGQEARKSPRMHEDNFEPTIENELYLDSDEVAFFLPKLNAADYFAALGKSGGPEADKTVEEIDREFSLPDGITDPEILEGIARERASRLEQAEYARRFLSISKPVCRLVDQARAKTFLALSDGSLKAKGFILNVNEEDGCQYCETVEIRPEEWNLDGIDWDLASTGQSTNEVRCAYVSTNEMLSIFPPSDLLGTPIAGKVFGSTFIPDSAADTKHATSNTNFQMRRGRPKIAGGLAETACCNEYRRLENAGGLYGKKDANLQKMIDWAKEILEREVSRSTMQRWIAGSEKTAQK